MKSNFLNQTQMKTTKLFTILILVMSMLSACSDDDNPEEVLEEEFITDVQLTFTNNADPNDTVILTSNAPDGQDGASTENRIGSFTAGATYSLSLSVLNAQETPADDVLNDDIIPEADEHFFTFAVNGLDISMSRDASDIDAANGTKLGVNTTWVANTVSTGSLEITLVHEPVGASDSNPFGSVTGGEEDFNITWTGLQIQ